MSDKTSALLEDGALIAEQLTDTSEFSINVLLNEIIQKISLTNLALQVSVVITAVLLGWVFSKYFKTSVKIWLIHLRARANEHLAEVERGKKKSALRIRTAYWPRAVSFAMELVMGVSFSLFSGAILALGAYAMVRFGFDQTTLILCRLSYTVLFAIACLSIILQCLKVFSATQEISHGLTKAVKVIFWALVAMQFFGVLEPMISALDSITLPIGNGISIWKCIMALLTVVLMVWVASGLARVLDGFVMAQEAFSPNLRVAVSRVIRITLFIIATILALSAVGFDLGVLSIFGGALGVGIGFGLQKIASNYISGFIILLDKSVKLGDMVMVNGFKGRVTEINTRFTVVRNNDGVENVVPNESFVTSPVLNYSYSEESSVQYIDVSVAYDADVERALQILREEGMRERSRILKGRKGWSYIDSLGDSGINLRLGFWVVDPKNGIGSIKTAIYLDVLRRFKEEGIEIPYNMLELNLRKVEAEKILGFPLESIMQKKPGEEKLQTQPEDKPVKVD